MPTKWPEIEIQTVTLRRIDREGKKPMFFQSAIFHRGDGVALPCDLMVQETQPHKPGRYPISVRSFIPGRFGDIQLRFELDPPVAAGKAA